MVYWNWKVTRDGTIRFSLILLALSFSYQNLAWLNSHFLPQIPVGYILLGVSGIFTLRHIYRTFRWYRIWLNGKRYQKYEMLIAHICLYLVVISVVLSVPISIAGRVSEISIINSLSDDTNNITDDTNSITDELIAQSIPTEPLLEDSNYIPTSPINRRSLEMDDYRITYFLMDGDREYNKITNIQFENTNVNTPALEEITITNISARYRDGREIYGLHTPILPTTFILEPYEKYPVSVLFRSLDTTIESNIEMTITHHLREYNGMPATTSITDVIILKP